MFATCSLSFTILLIAVTGSAQSTQIPPRNDSASIVGNWTLINLAYPKDRRTIVFDPNLGGSYYTNDRQPKRISDVIYKGGLLYFKVPELRLYFTMRRVGERFDGKMIVYGGTDRRAPEAVRMTRN